MCRLRTIAVMAAFCCCVGLILPTTVSGQITPISVDGKIMEQKIIKRVEPDYPDGAVRARMEGTVRLRVSINERGEVTNVKIIGGGDRLLQLSAAKAVYKWQYSAYTDANGQAIPVITEVNVIFKLPKKLPSF